MRKIVILAASRHPSCCRPLSLEAMPSRGIVEWHAQPQHFLSKFIRLASSKVTTTKNPEKPKAKSGGARTPKNLTKIHRYDKDFDHLIAQKLSHPSNTSTGFHFNANSDRRWNQTSTLRLDTKIDDEPLVKDQPAQSSSPLGIVSGSSAATELFDLLCDDDEKIKKTDFLRCIADSGLRWNDPRLETVVAEIAPGVALRGGGVGGPDLGMLIDTSGDIDLEKFRKIVVHNLDLIERAVRHDFVIPDFSDFTKRLERIYLACRDNEAGDVATYIPQLAKVNPKLWAMAVCTVDGQRYSIGNVDTQFCLQSCVKPLSYALALHELGSDNVHRYVGQEPSGQHFNAVSLDSLNRPHNPMINAGAILCCSLLKPELSLSDRFEYFNAYLKRMCGGESVGFNNSVFLSERETADRNFALAYYMREHKCFPEGNNLMETLDFYFQQCSIEVTCDSASVLAATLANGGVCPITGESIVNPQAVCHTLSLMLSCGMYDYSGQFAFKIGLPAKSGVSGATLLVIPNLAGICIYSPRLDALGNSCRGIQFCELLVKEFNFHHLDPSRFLRQKHDPKQRRADKAVHTTLSLIYSAAIGDIMSVTRAAMSGADMNAVDYDGRTALHLAANEGHADIVKFLLAKCHVNATPRDRWGRTPSEGAAVAGLTEIEAMINASANEAASKVSNQQNSKIQVQGGGRQYGSSGSGPMTRHDSGASAELSPPPFTK